MNHYEIALFLGPVSVDRNVAIEIVKRNSRAFFIYFLFNLPDRYDCNQWQLIHSLLHTVGGGLFSKQRNYSVKTFETTLSFVIYILVQIFGQRMNFEEIIMKQAFIVKITCYYLLLYFLTVAYNISNKIVLNSLPLPVSIAALQLFLGLPLFLPLWFINPPRNLLNISFSSYSVISICHALGNLTTIYSLASGSVSFTHVVKSAEPIFTALLSVLVSKASFSIEVYISLLPIVIGVAMASLKESTFSMYGFLTAMASNLFYQLRIVLSKQLMSPNDGTTKLSGPNMFRVVTIISFLQLFPIAIYCEGTATVEAISRLWTDSGTNQATNSYLLTHLLLSGFTYYGYNEVAFWILDLVHPVTHAVGNTIKRVVLIIASLIIFRNPITLIGATGSAIAILGSFLYVLAHERYSRRETVVVTNGHS